ncbi:MAG: hypothetical protein M1832_005951 [Thelocarpon impressellum]|nr:MAG: hypothetical protein M1832_005951 [Thelocarpon impressellum]
MSRTAEDMSALASPSAIRTPATAPRIRPPHAEMHPSKAQRSTSKQPDSGLRLGFADASSHKSLEQLTPTKVNGKSSGPPSSPSFQFRFTRKAPELGVDAQKMMDDLREDALQIKATLAAQQQEAERVKNSKADDQPLLGVGGRRLAKAKGKAGRYSAAHRAEFDKMFSIADTARAVAEASKPATQTLSVQPGKPSLKRARSQALRDENDAPAAHRSQSTSPVKRVKRVAGDDTSSVSTAAKSTVPAMSRANSSLPRAAMTPTKASLARSASVKVTNALSPSNFRRLATSPLRVGAKSEGSKKYLSSLAGINRVKSILRPPQIFNTEERGKVDLDKELPSLPGTPSGIPRSRSVKRVGFTPTTFEKSLFDASPSPARVVVQQSPSKPRAVDSTVTYPTLPQVTVSSPARPTSSGLGSLPSVKLGPASTIRAVRPSFVGADVEKATIIPVVPHGLPNKKRARDDETSDEENQEPQVKKHRGGPTQMTPKRQPKGKAGSSNIPTPKKGGATPMGTRRILSLSKRRLNALARPKERAGEDA